MKHDSLKYLPLSDSEKTDILKKLGRESVEDLFRSIPDSVKKQTSASLADPLSEIEVRDIYRDSIASNGIRRSFLGGAGHTHYIPSIIDPIVSRGEFLTAYTPYQPEVSQGTLQAMFEFQSMMADMMGVDVSNASLYDGSTAMLEAVLMAVRITKKRRIYFAKSIHPEYLKTMQTYADTDVFDYGMIDTAKDGTIKMDELSSLKDDCAALVIQSPNYFGVIEQIKKIKTSLPPKVLLITVVTEGLSLAYLRAPGKEGADIVCGEAQSFGVPLSFGGPWLGFIGTSIAHVRNMPGRLVGETKDMDGKRAFVVTLAAREQHIRREKATSNICTNQGLMTLRAAIYLSVMGKMGVRRAAERSSKFAALGRDLLKDSKIKFPYSAPYFNEFVIELPVSAEKVFDSCVSSAGIAPGTIVGEKSLLCAFDETMTPAVVKTWAKTLLEAI